MQTKSRMCTLTWGRTSNFAVATLLVVSAWPLSSQADTAEGSSELSPITVEGQFESSPYIAEPEQSPEQFPDTAEILKGAPGANVNRNGGLTGIAQYRGLFGDRVNVLVDGMNINAACTNAMDTPLSHVPRMQLESLEVVRGIAPVSSGLETLGGTIIANTRSGEYGDSNAFKAGLSGSLGGASVNDSYAGSALGWVANAQHKFYADVSAEAGADTRFADGDITPSEYQRERYAAGYGHRSDRHELMLDLAYNQTGESGTPSLPMDILYADTSLGKVDYRYHGGGYQLHGRVSYSQTDHVMTNYALREAPNGKTRRANTEASGTGYRLDTTVAAWGGALNLGVDGHLATHDAYIVDPNNANFYVDNFRDTQRNRYGAFGEWTGGVGAGWTMQFGLRFTQVQMDTSTVNHSMYGMNPGVTALQDRFNNADRSQTDNNIDWALQFERRVSMHSNLVTGVARKSRSPTYQERYLWIPLESTAGLADGNLYVGDIQLNPEVSHQLELGLDWSRGAFWAAPRLFYREVADYIQGTPATDGTVVAVATANGDATPLQFSNVDATLYGVDTSYGVALGRRWRVSGVLSYVRGERDDIEDNLYRIYPFNGSLGIGYQAQRWGLTAQSQFAANQSKVSRTNEEQSTAGYAVYNLFGSLTLTESAYVQLGVSNLFDRVYAEHTTGINRVINSDIGMRERVPSPGRSFYATLRFSL